MTAWAIATFPILTRNYFPVCFNIFLVFFSWLQVYPGSIAGLSQTQLKPRRGQRAVTKMSCIADVCIWDQSGKQYRFSFASLYFVSYVSNGADLHTNLRERAHMRLRTLGPREPLLAPCYCNQCKRPLSQGRVMDNHHAWCPKCKSIVSTASMQIPAWTVGTTALLFLLFFLTRAQ